LLEDLRKKQSNFHSAVSGLRAAESNWKAFQFNNIDSGSRLPYPSIQNTPQSINHPSLINILIPPIQAPFATNSAIPGKISIPKTASKNPRCPKQQTATEDTLDAIKRQGTLQLPILTGDDSSHDVPTTSLLPLNDVGPKFLERLDFHPELFTDKDKNMLCEMLLMDIFGIAGHKNARKIVLALYQTEHQSNKTHYHAEFKSHDAYNRLIAAGQKELAEVVSSWLFVNKHEKSVINRFMCMLKSYQLVEFWEALDDLPPEKMAMIHETLCRELETLQRKAAELTKGLRQNSLDNGFDSTSFEPNSSKHIGKMETLKVLSIYVSGVGGLAVGLAVQK